MTDNESKLPEGNSDLSEETISTNAADTEPPIRGLMEFMASVTHDNPMTDNLKPEHITQILDNERKSLELESRNNIVRTVSTLITVFLVIAALITVICLLRTNNADIMDSVIEKFLYFAAGAFGGYGYCKARR